MMRLVIACAAALVATTPAAAASRRGRGGRETSKAQAAREAGERAGAAREAAVDDAVLVRALRDLAALRAEGVLTAREVAEKRQQLLGFSRTDCPVVFRLDDVQDHYLAASARAVIDVFARVQAPLALGVIGGFFGKDPRTVAAVARAVAAGGEVANHGSSDEPLDGLAPARARAYVAAAHAAVANATGYSPRTFVPPRNRWSPALLRALADLNYTVVSGAAAWTEMPMRFSSGSVPARLPMVATTGDLRRQTTWRAVPNARILAAIALACDADGAAVVLMHPQEFDAGVATIKSLKALVRSVRARGHRISTFQGALARLRGSP